MNSSSVIPVVIDRHAEDAAFLWLLRNAAVHEPHYDLGDLAELDNRLAAHLDGLLIAGDYGWEIAKNALGIGEPGEVFVAGWLAAGTLDGKKIDLILEAAKGSKENYGALVSALAWHPLESIIDLVKSFLNANDPVYQALGISACALHRTDPRASLQKALAHSDEQTVARTLRAIGELRRIDLVPAITPFRNSKTESHNFWANWSVALMGDRSAVGPLQQHVLNDTNFAIRALRLIARVMDQKDAQNLFQALARDKSTMRLAMMGAGISGDPMWIPGLLKHMENPDIQRVAGEAFSTITGVDLAYEELNEDWPEGLEAGPTEDPADENVAMDEDEDLPWPNRVLLLQWWEENKQHFQPGNRYLCGKPISEQNCINVLHNGFQRQRNAAALELALLGKPFYETRAPGFRQKRQLKVG
ncbi:MAG: TIGR02270 family protein [Pseudomonadales bacterium]